MSTLTGTQVLLLIASENGHVYTFATPKLQPLITQSRGKEFIQSCLNGTEVTTADAEADLQQQALNAQRQQPKEQRQQSSRPNSAGCSSSSSDFVNNDSPSAAAVAQSHQQHPQIPLIPSQQPMVGEREYQTGGFNSINNQSLNS